MTIWEDGTYKPSKAEIALGTIKRWRYIMNPWDEVHKWALFGGIGTMYYLLFLDGIGVL